MAGHSSRSRGTGEWAWASGVADGIVFSDSLTSNLLCFLAHSVVLDEAQCIKVCAEMQCSGRAAYQS